MTLEERVISWREPWIRHGMEQGIRQGVEQGIRKGVEQGDARGVDRERGLLRRQAKARFGADVWRSACSHCWRKRTTSSGSKRLAKPSCVAKPRRTCCVAPRRTVGAEGRPTKRAVANLQPPRTVAAGYSTASCRVPSSHAVTTSSATAPGTSSLTPTSVQAGYGALMYRFFTSLKGAKVRRKSRR